MATVGGAEPTADRIQARSGRCGVKLDGLFPLHLLKDAGGRPVGRTRVRRWRQEVRQVADQDALITSLNWCAGCNTPTARIDPALCGPGLRSVYARIMGLVSDTAPVAAIPNRRAAFLELLRGRCVYDQRDGGLNLVSFRSVSRISLPSSTAGSPAVETVVSDAARQFLGGDLQRMLRSNDEVKALKEAKKITPYMDRILATSRRRYLQVIRALLKRDMVTMLDPSEVHEHVGLFFGGEERQGDPEVDHRCEGCQPALPTPTRCGSGDVRRIITDGGGGPSRLE